MPQDPEPEIYTPERIAQFLLNNAGNAEQYSHAVEEALELGVDPTTLDPEALIQDVPWQNPALYVASAKAKRKG